MVERCDREGDAGGAGGCNSGRLWLAASCCRASASSGRPRCRRSRVAAANEILLCHSEQFLKVNADDSWTNVLMLDGEVVDLDWQRWAGSSAVN